MGASRERIECLQKRNLNSTIAPPRTPGSLGKNDSSDPNRKAKLGDTPGSLGVKDFASPKSEKSCSAINSVTSESHEQLNHAFQLVEDLIRSGNATGLAYAASLMRFWRDGGDDKLGSARSETAWQDMHGKDKSGKKIPAEVFWPGQRHSIPGKLASHREAFVRGAQTRVRDGRLGFPEWASEMIYTAASGNWGPSDLQFALGPCSLNSRVRVRVQSITRKGETVTLAAGVKPISGDKVRVSFIEWVVFLSDRYDWQHGKSGAAGSMALMNILHLVRYGAYDNPQKILGMMESSYGFGDPNLLRVYARPFDVETKPVTLREAGSPNLDIEKFGTQEHAVPFTAVMRPFDVVV